MKLLFRLILLVLGLAGRVSAQPAALSGDQILAKSARTYLDFKVYRGDCHVISTMTMSVKSAPAQTIKQKAQAKFDFKRDDHFNIEGLDVAGGSFSIESRGAKTKLTTHLGGKTQVEKTDDLEGATASMTGVAATAPTTIPALLMGGNWGFPFQPTGATLKGHEILAGHDCFVVSQSFAALNQLSTFWIDSQSFLLRQMREKRGEMKFSAAQLKEMPRMADFKILSSQFTHVFSIEEAGDGQWWQPFPRAT